MEASSTSWMIRLADHTRRPTSQRWRHLASAGAIIRLSKLGRWIDRDPPTFTVNHFNGPVSYSSEGPLKCNLDSLNPDFVSLLHGSLAGALDGAEGAGSANPFVKGLFSAKTISVLLMWRSRNEIIAEAEAGLDVRSIGDLYAPYASPGLPPDDYTDPYNQVSSQAHIPLVVYASPFQRGNLYDDDYEDHKSFRSDDFDNRSRLTSNREETSSNYGPESYAPYRNMFQNADKEGLPVIAKEALAGEIMENETTEVVKETLARRRWVLLCWLLTWWIPSIFLKWFGRMKRARTSAKLGGRSSRSTSSFGSSVLVRFSTRLEHLRACIASTHQRVVSVIPTKSILQYGGQDATNLFPVQVSALCNGVSGSVSPWVQLSAANTTDLNAQYHDFRAVSNDSRPDWYFESMTIMRWNNRVGYMGYTPQEISSMANTNGRAFGIYDGLIYDLTEYVNLGPSVQGPHGEVAPSADSQFMDSTLVNLFKYSSGQDLTKAIDHLNIDSGTLAAQKTGLRNLFLIGMVDSRNSPQCLFSQYILLALSVMMVSIIAFNFIASINFGSPHAPEDHDKFVICQVPCYTEGEVSRRRTIDSLAQLKYDDKHKLILVICDGNIVGSGNDRPTPRIVLDILGVDSNLDPEPLSFVSLGKGARQHNMGKVYSGLYECAGHVVPYLVIVKVGKPMERSRPGNRGKRDSQMVMMHFLNKVHFNLPMNPLELEIYYQIKNVIGVNPTFYEYLFTIDADTTVGPYSLNWLISAMVHDKKVLGVCGETTLSNAKQSVITMMQVYEYFISHHMAKAFESLFGSVTCLPGCFTLFRLRTPDTQKPLLISNQMISDYSQNRVDTLHMKNLLHLGEDRYLTTLLLKHSPMHKTQFVRDAHAYTVAPDDWKILLSQRRLWINFAVSAPITVAYIVYLIVSVAGQGKTIPVISLIMIGAVYGLQALVFVLRRKWDMVGWMVFYIIAIPIFSFLLPIYSFWPMDDFSWGTTRVVLGESGKKLIVHDEGKFDPHAIPLKTWNNYENELWDKESNHSIGSWVASWPYPVESRMLSYMCWEYVRLQAFTHISRGLYNNLGRRTIR
ncbi:chitin synthase-domain-containing protein [Boletus edulis]|nr:chitin synthase-domain-containing protein [Boletus edulis]KAF8135823.1 chitin synthase-domain-containing protein [Boletus edulis]